MYERISLKAYELFLALKREEGQGATEYALVVGFIIVALAVTVGALGTSISGLLTRVAGDLDQIWP